MHEPGLVYDLLFTMWTVRFQGECFELKAGQKERTQKRFCIRPQRRRMLLLRVYLLNLLRLSESVMRVFSGGENE